MFGLKDELLPMESLFSRFKRILSVLPLMVLSGAGIQLFFSYILGLLLSLSSEAADEYDQVMAPLLSMTPEMILHVCVRAPLFEELLFRGIGLGFFCLLCFFLITLLKEKESAFLEEHMRAGRFLPRYGYAAANVLQALLFGIYHGNIYQGGYAFIIGLIFGWICLRARSVVPGIAAHSSVNLCGLIMESLLPADTGEGIRFLLAAAGLFLTITCLRRFANRETIH